MKGMKRITVGEVIAAMEKNGFRHARGSWVRPIHPKDWRKKSTIGAACIIGQAAINLGVGATQLQSALDNIAIFGDSNDISRLGSTIADRNDAPGISYQRVLAFAKSLLSPHSERTISVIEHNWEAEYDVEGSRIAKLPSN